MMPEREQIVETLVQNREVLERLGVRRIGLFGSGARGTARETSDLDFLVEFRAKSFDAYMDLKFFLEELFQHDIDLVLLDSIKPRLKRTILAEAIYAPGFEGLS